MTDSAIQFFLLSIDLNYIKDLFQNTKIMYYDAAFELKKF